MKGEEYYVHESAVVDDTAVIGNGTKLWHQVQVREHAVIGASCVIGKNVYVGSGVRIGNGVKVQNNVSVYEGVVLEDEVFCGPSVVFTNVINPRAFIERKTEFKETRVKSGASLGANCTIICGNSIGEYAFIGAGAVVTKSVSPYALMVGNPAIQVGWVSRYGARLDLPLRGSGQCRCSETNELYRLDQGQVYPK